MVMEPLSAFALACNILQIVEYGSKALTTAAELYRASQGGSSEVNRILGITDNLRKTSEALEKVIGTDPANSSQPQPIERHLYAANLEVALLSQKFRAVLEKYIPEGNGMPARIQSLRNAFRLRWRKEDLQSLERNLGHARSNLVLAFLLFMQ